jgi:hypothetical protein
MASPNVLLLICFVAVLNSVFVSAGFDMAQANISVWVAGAAACGAENYMTHVFKGPTTGFVVTHVINDYKATEGFVGYLPSDNAIHVSFRGSSSTRNWLTDAYCVKTPYTTFPECNAEVHKGFFQAEQTVFPQVLNEVKKLKSQFPSYTVKVTGHSYGASMAQLTAMDLVANGVSVKQMYNFGQPRTGTKAFSDCTGKKMGNSDVYRFVHNKDDVPHLPTIGYMDYWHVCTEVFEDVSGKVKVCDSSCEDPSCSDQFEGKELNPDDHMYYLGIHMTCDGVSR